MYETKFKLNSNTNFTIFNDLVQDFWKVINLINYTNVDYLDINNIRSIIINKVMSLNIRLNKVQSHIK